MGSDADITILDPEIRKKVSVNELHLRDYSPWDGWDVTGWPTTVILRGKVMVEDNKFFGELTDGQLIHRKIDGSVLRSPAF